MGKDSDLIDLDAASSALRVGPFFTLADVDPDAAPGFPKTKGSGKDLGEDLFDDRDDEITDLQERMYARARADDPDAPALLVVLQGMDAAGKGGIIRHVFGTVDPQGLHIASFKRPTAEELSHDFLWRIRKRLPAPGTIGIFDRSHYEDVLIQRVRKMAPPEEIERRYGAIAEFESDLANSGTRILKFMLHVGRDEQEERLLERIERRDKHWKYNPGDVDERLRWDDYTAAYQAVLDRTSTPHAPWYAVPADRKWFARLAVTELLLDALESLDLSWPEADFDVAAEIARLENS